MAIEVSPNDPRLAWVLRQIRLHYRSSDLSNMTFAPADEASLRDFLDGTAILALWFSEHKNVVTLSVKPPNLAKTLPKEQGSMGGYLYFLKLKAVAVSATASIGEQILVGDLPPGVNALEHMARVSSEIYLPMVSNPRHREEWSELIVKDVLEGVNSYVANIQIIQGQVEGRTRLPLPPDSAVLEVQEPSLSFEDRVFMDTEGEEAIANRDRIYVLEGAIITWTKQIRKVMAADPEEELTKSHPGPSEEIEFWAAMAKNLDAVFVQLQSEKVRRVLRYLDRAKSTYTAPFGKLCKEMFLARSKARSNQKFLRALKPWVDAFENEPSFEGLGKHIPPIMHTVLLIWKASPYYNTVPRMVVLMQELGNSLVKKATAFVTGDRLFEMMDSGESVAAVECLRTLLRVLGGFKASYFDYKARSVVEVPENPWTASNNACFKRLDKFLERCHDVMDVAQTVLQYQRLEGVKIGGQRGRTLTTSIMQVYQDFCKSVDHVRNLGFDILDIDQKFEPAWYTFRREMKMLDHRLAALIDQGFEEASTVAQSFKLFDSFQGLVERPLIYERLETRYLEVIAMYAADLRVAQDVFVRLCDDPPVASHMSPCAGALAWSFGLEARARGPMLKVKRLDKRVLDSAIGREVIADFTSLIGYLEGYRRDVLLDWTESVKEVSAAKLKQPLLRRSSFGDDGVQALFVNLDPLLVSLLRECKYMELLGVELPPHAKDLFAQAEILRKLSSNLQLVCTMYNHVQASLLPVERPLMRNALDKADRLLAQSVAVDGDGSSSSSSSSSSAANDGSVPMMTWKSTGIDHFVAEAIAEVGHVDETLKTVKANQGRIEQLLDTWSNTGLFARYQRSANLSDFDKLQRGLRAQRYALIKAGGAEIASLLDVTCGQLGISHGHPDWRAYVDFVNNVVVGGLVQVVIVSLEYVEKQLDPLAILQTKSNPMLDIGLDLVGTNGVQFVPVIEHVPGSGRDPGKQGIRDVAQAWLDAFLAVGSQFPRLDSGEGSYVKELQDDPYVAMLLTSVNSLLSATEKKAQEYFKHFENYTWLWTTDLPGMFQEFIVKAVVKHDLDEVAAYEEAANNSSKQSNGNDSDSSDEEEGRQHQEAKETLIKSGSVQGAEPLPDEIDLRSFDLKLRELMKVQKEVASLKPSWDCDFLRVNTQPAKQGLSTWVTKWTYLFTDYLQQYLNKRVKDMHAFMYDALAQLTRPRLEGDRASLIALMQIVQKVRQKMAFMAASFDPLNECVALLQTHRIPVELEPLESPDGPEEALEFLANAGLLWDEVLNLCFKVKEAIVPEQLALLDNIRGELASFGHRCYKFGKHFKKLAPFNYQYHATPEGAGMEEKARRGRQSHPPRALWLNPHHTATNHDQATAMHTKVLVAAANASAAASRAHDDNEDGELVLRSPTTAAAGSSVSKFENKNKIEPPKSAETFCRSAYLSLEQLEEGLKMLENEAQELQELGDLFEIDTNLLAQPSRSPSRHSSRSPSRRNSKGGITEPTSPSSPQPAESGRLRLLHIHPSQEPLTPTSPNVLSARSALSPRSPGSSSPRKKEKYKPFKELLKDTRTEILHLKLVWDAASRIRYCTDAWRRAWFLEVDLEDLIDRAHKLESYMSKKLPKKLVKSWSCYQGACTEVKALHVSLTLALAVRQAPMRDRHWRALAAACGIHFDGTDGHKPPPFPHVPLSAILDFHAHLYIESVRDVISAAEAEAKVEASLDVIEGAWEHHRLAFKEWGDTGVGLPVDVNGTVEQLEEHQAELQATHVAMKAATVSGPVNTTSTDFFKGEVEKWQHMLGIVEEVVKLLGAASKHWSALEVLFPTLMNEDNDSSSFELSHEAVVLYKDADRCLKEVLNEAIKPSVVTFSMGEGRVYSLRRLVTDFERCAAALDHYVEGKVDVFPRFSFLPPAAVLQCLALDHNLPGVLPLVESAFDGLHDLLWGYSDIAKRNIANQLQELEKKREKALQKLEKPALAEAARIEKAHDDAIANDEDWVDDGSRPHMEAFKALQKEYELAGPVQLLKPMPFDQATGMVSKDGEEVLFGVPFLFNANGRVENWLTTLLTVTKDAVRNSTATLMEQVPRWEKDLPRHTWAVESGCAQAMLMAAQATFTLEAEAALEELEGGTEDALATFMEAFGLRLEQLVLSVQGILTSGQRVKLANLVTQDLHDRDTMETLINKHATSALDFTWTAHFKYYWSLDAKQMSASLGEFASSHSYEYCGNTTRLVLTPLTDRCYLALTSALRLNLGAALSGPTGLGKGGTVRELAKMLGVLCVSFNCSEDFDAQSIARAFSGLAQCGAWGVFQEVNCLAHGSLSMMAQMLKELLDAITRFAVPANREEEYESLPEGTPNVKVGDFEFASKGLISLVPSCGVFLSLSPSYAGRLPLPRRLTVLFRPVAVIAPDAAVILEYRFFAEGFVKGALLATKLVTFHRFAKNMLSQAPHYDWSFRNLMALLHTCIDLRQSSPGVDEEVLLMRALKSATYSKLLERDVKLFDSILEDLFPGKSAEIDKSGPLADCLPQVCKDNGLTAGVGFSDKVLQCAELLAQRQAVVVLGPAGCGKSTVWKTLVKAQNIAQREAVFKEYEMAVKESDKVGGPVPPPIEASDPRLRPCTVYDSLNPQAVTSTELYGYYAHSREDGGSESTTDWREGCLTWVARGMCEGRPPLYGAHQSAQWLVLDGALDSTWAESLNTCLDEDVRSLTLTSGERLRFNDALKLVFEVDSVQHATPATMSRCGVLHLDALVVGFEPLVAKWLKQQGEEQEEVDAGGDEDEEGGHNGGPTMKSILKDLFARHLPTALLALDTATATFLVPMEPIFMVSSLLRILGGYLKRLPKAQKESKAHLEPLFLHAAVWAFGGAVACDATSGMHSGEEGGGNLNARQAFDVTWRQCFKEHGNVEWPREGVVWDYFAAPLPPPQDEHEAGGDKKALSSHHYHHHKDHQHHHKHKQQHSHHGVKKLPPQSPGHGWVHWSTAMPSYVPSGELYFSAMRVPTVDGTRIGHLLALLEAESCPVLLVGGTGAGKTAMVRDWLREEEDRRGIKGTNVSINYYTDSKRLQDQLEEPLERRGGQVFGPSGKGLYGKLVYFIDDLNMSEESQYKVQPPLELLRQWADYKWWTDREGLTQKKVIVDVRLVAAMNHKAGSFFVSSRLLRHMTVLGVQTPSNGDLSRIYTSILDHHLLPFRDDVRSASHALVEATLMMYNEVALRFKPSAPKFFYQTSPRDLASVMQGLCLSSPLYCRSALSLCRLWFHEVQRTFGDKLVTTIESERCLDLAKETSRRLLGKWAHPEDLFVDPCLFTSFATPTIEDQPDALSRTSTSLKASTSSAYLAVSDLPTLRLLLHERLCDYNEAGGHASMDLVLFDDAMSHICRLARILSRPGGNALVIGVSGTGKTSLAKMAAFCVGLHLYVLGEVDSRHAPHHGDGGGASEHNQHDDDEALESLRQELRVLQKKAGASPGEPTAFLYSDSQVKDERSLSLINDFLSSGVIHGLFSAAEEDEIINLVRPAARADGVIDSKPQLLDYFTAKVQANLHVVLCASPAGHSLRRRVRMFPALISCTCLNYVAAWPQKALVEVASHFFQQMPGLRVPKGPSAVQEKEKLKLQSGADKQSGDGDGEKEAGAIVPHQSTATGDRSTPAFGASDLAPPSLNHHASSGHSPAAENLAFHLARVHESALAAAEKAQGDEKRSVAVTSKCFLEAIHMFRRLVVKQGTQLETSMAQFEKGLGVMQHVEDDVKVLKEDLRRKNVALARSKASSESTLSKMGAAREEADAQAKNADIERNKVEKAEQEASHLQQQASSELAIAQPALEAAREAVAQVTKESLAELKALPRLPTGCDKVAAALLMVLKNEKRDFGWENARKMMAKAEVFLKQVTNFTGEHIDPDAMHRLQAIIDDPMFNFEKLVTKSEASAHLCNWVIHIYEFHRTYRRVAPLMMQLATAQEDQAQAESDLESIEGDLRKIDRKLTLYKADFEQLTEERAIDDVGAQGVLKRVKLAERLQKGLGDEVGRWLQEVERLRANRKTLVGDAVLCATFLAYAGPFSQATRTDLWQKIWVQDLASRGIVSREDADPMDLLVDTPTRAQWSKEGLPQDRCSTENGVLVAQTLDLERRWPLLIDPQGQGLLWVKAREHELILEKQKQGSVPAIDSATPRDGKNSSSLAKGAASSELQPPPLSPVSMTSGLSTDAGAASSVVGGGSMKGLGTTPPRSVPGTAPGTAPAPEKGVLVVAPSEPKWLDKVAGAVQHGLAVVVKGLDDTIGAPRELTPLIRKATFERGHNRFVQFMGQEMEYHPSFRLYLVTSMPSPSLPPSLAAACTTVDFTVSDTAVEELLLSSLVRAEKPSLEDDRQNLTTKSLSHTMKLATIEARVLDRLCNAPADLLGDVPLIQEMENCRDEVDGVKHTIEKDVKLEVSITRSRDMYRAVAKESAGVYFQALSLRHHHPLYCFPLPAFREAFLKGARKSEESEDPRRRIQHLRVGIRSELFQVVNRSLLSEHRPLYLVMVCLNYLNAEVFHHAQVKKFKKQDRERRRDEDSDDDNDDDESGMPDDATAATDRTPPPAPFIEEPWRDVGFTFDALQFLLKPLPEPAPLAAGAQRVCPVEWLSEANWQHAQLLSHSVEGFEDFGYNLGDSAPRFLDWFNHPAPESIRLPLEWRLLDNKPFRKLLVVKALRPERLPEALRKFCRAILPEGKSLAEADSDHSSLQVLDGAFQDASNDHYMWLVAGRGHDVIGDLDILASQNNLTPGVSYHILPGGGSIDDASAVMRDARQHGHWITLADAHLCKWLPTPAALTLIDGLGEEHSAHPNFRLFFVAAPQSQSPLPLAILERCQRVAFDQPVGVRATLLGALCCFSKDSVEEMPPSQRGILFGICFFHAVLKERSFYGPLGYNFTPTLGFNDILQCSTLLSGYYAEEEPLEMPWEDLRCLFAEVMYGGHFGCDHWDSKVVKAYADFIFQDSLLEEPDLFPYPDKANSGSPVFHAPSTTRSFESLLEHVSDTCVESPLLYGLHPNTDLESRASKGRELVSDLMTSALLSTGGIEGLAGIPTEDGDENGGARGIGGDESIDGGGSTRGGGASSNKVVLPGTVPKSAAVTAKAEFVAQELLERFGFHAVKRGVELELVEKECGVQGIGPFQALFLSESAQLNHLLLVIAQSLDELDRGFKGELGWSEAMEATELSLYLNAVPLVWQRGGGYPTCRQLFDWCADLEKRLEQMEAWAKKPSVLPVATWLSGLFNPAAFLSATMQVFAHENAIDLDAIVISTEVTKKMSPDDYAIGSRDGQYVYGLFLEGARYTISASMLEPCLPRSFLNPMPVLNLRPVVASSGDENPLRGDDGNSNYECPVYMTRQRGASYVFTASLRTKQPPAKWVLAGVALLMDDKAPMG